MPGPPDPSPDRHTDRNTDGHTDGHPAGQPPRHPPAQPGKDTVTDVVRWAAFSCVLVPVALLWYGTSLAGAAGTAFGLAAVTAVCRLLLRRSERARTGARGGGRHTGGSTPVD